MKKKSLFGFTVIIVTLLIVGFLIVVFGGIYNVGTTDKHIAPVEWVFRKTMESSVRNHAKYIKMPDTINLRIKNWRENFMPLTPKPAKLVMEHPDENQTRGCIFIRQLLT